MKKLLGLVVIMRLEELEVCDTCQIRISHPTKLFNRSLWIPGFCWGLHLGETLGWSGKYFLTMWLHLLYWLSSLEALVSESWWFLRKLHLGGSINRGSWSLVILYQQAFCAQIWYPGDSCPHSIYDIVHVITVVCHLVSVSVLLPTYFIV